jgi:Ca2+-binding EF-hand superfamily protein
VKVRAFLILFLACGFARADDRAKPRATASEGHDFVFLAEARPILVRVHVTVDGKPLQAAWDDFVKHLFNELDKNKDGTLDKAEIERAPAADLILSGGLGAGFGQWTPGPKFEDLDSNKDGKVTLAEFASYYRKHGLEPFQFQLKPAPQNPLGGLLGGQRPEPSVSAVSERIFALLAGKDGKLTAEKLAAAQVLLMKLDDDGDELITPSEVVTDAKASDALGGMAMMVRNNVDSGKTPASSETVVPVPTRGEAPTDLTRRLQERYGSKTGKPEEIFASLDPSKFVNRTPDLEVTIELGQAESRVDCKSSAKVALRDRGAAVDLGKTRIDFVGDVREKNDAYSSILRQQGIGQPKQADKQNKGYLTEEDAKSNRTLQGLFKAADTNGDGKLTEAEITAYFEWLSDLQSRASSACVSLVLSDESRGLFDLLDTNRDGKLSLRELRQAPKLLSELDHAGKGYLVREDVPRSYRLTLRKGPADGQGIAGIAAALSQYFTSYSSNDAGGPKAGPLWFRKMDRNRDGDVSRKEFIGTDEDFRKIDTDGDGLISLEEAIKADVWMRKQKKD